MPNKVTVKANVAHVTELNAVGGPGPNVIRYGQQPGLCVLACMLACVFALVKVRLRGNTLAGSVKRCWCWCGFEAAR